MPTLRTISRDPAMWGEEGGAALVICSDGVWDAWSSAQQPHEQVATWCTLTLTLTLILALPLTLTLTRWRATCATARVRRRRRRKWWPR